MSGLQLLCESPVPLSQDMSRQLGLPLPREDPLLVPRHPPRLLLGHEVREVPDVFPDEPTLRPGLVEGLEVLLDELDLVLLGEDHGWLHVDPGHGVGPVLRHHDRLACGSPPVLQLGEHLPLDELGVTGVGVPGEVSVDGDDVEVLTDEVLIPGTVGHDRDGPGGS